MNEVIEASAAMLNYTTEPQKVVDIIKKTLFRTRPKNKVKNIPYVKSDICWAEKPLGKLHIDLKKMYPTSENGDVVYADFNVDSISDIEMVISLSPDVVLIKDGNVVYDGTKDGEEVKIPVVLNEGSNFFSVKCTCREDKFGFYIMISTKEYSFMWAKDLLYNVRNTIPVKEYKNEEGFAISRLFKSNETAEMEQYENGDKKYEFPAMIQYSQHKDFMPLYAKEKGCIAYALSYANSDGAVSIHFDSSAVIFLNDEEKFVCKKNESFELHLTKGDKVLIKSLKEDKWGFACSDDIFDMPYIESYRHSGDKWLLIGAFGEKDNLGFVYPPENIISLKKPYYNAEKGRTFWRLADGSYIRPYMDTFFFGQWFYALMVGHFGILNTYFAFGDKNAYDYFMESMNVIASYYDYAKYDAMEFETNPSILPRTYELCELDPIGTVGMNLSQAYLCAPDSELIALIRELEFALYQNVPKFEDGVINRVKTMWTDDLFMGCPFLVRLGILSGDKRHFDMAYTQFKGYYNRMFIKEEKIFSHIYFIDDEEKSNVPWGRGNGWVMVALADFLENVPKEYEHYQEIADIFKQFTEGIVNVQDTRGMWHQVLNRPESFIESSCTAMFLYGLSKGISMGILNEKYSLNADSAYKALLKNFIDKDGNIYGVCMGSGCNKDWHYYSDKLNTIKNEDHGTGIILAAISAYKEMNDGRK